MKLLKKILKSSIQPFRPQIEKVIVGRHGILGRKIGSKILNLNYFNKILSNNEINLLYNRLHWDKYKIQEYKFRKLKETIEYAYKYIPFYRQFYDKNSFHSSDLNDVDDVDKIPILKKHLLKEAFLEKSIFSKEKRKWNLIFSETTGSTGEPIKTCIDKNSFIIRNYATMRAFFINGILPGDPFIMIWRDKGIGRNTIKSFFYGNYLNIPIMDITDIKDTALDKEKIFHIFKKIEKFEPKIIRGYVSALYILAKYYEKYKNKFNIKIEKIIGSAEYLPFSTWSKVEEIFNCKVFNIYGSSETSPIAMSTVFSRDLIVFEDIYNIELINWEEKTIESGTGKIIVTDLHNRYMPLIRYEIGDIAEWGTNYQFGFRSFKEVKGRSNDLFVLPNNKIVFPDNWYIHFRDIDWINKFKVIQEDIDRIKIILEINNRFKECFMNSLKEKISSSYGSNIDFNWILTKNIPLDKGEKFRHIESKITVDEGLELLLNDKNT